MASLRRRTEDDGIWAPSWEKPRLATADRGDDFEWFYASGPKLEDANWEFPTHCCDPMSEVRGDFNGEVIDAIGSRAGVYAECSTLVECKTSRADYLADAKKPHRTNPEQGMGQYCYFTAPEGMLKAAELPLGWGLIEVTEKGQIRPRQGHVFLRRDDPDTWAHSHNKGAEWTLLARMLNRVGDVEVLQNRLKEALNTKARLAKSNDLMRKQLDAVGRDLFLARSRLEDAGLDAGFAVPAQRARPKLAAAFETNDLA